jgi:hypothetical protein
MTAMTPNIGNCSSIPALQEAVLPSSGKQSIGGNGICSDDSRCPNGGMIVEKPREVPPCTTTAFWRARTQVLPWPAPFVTKRRGILDNLLRFHDDSATTAAFAPALLICSG